MMTIVLGIWLVAVGFVLRFLYNAKRMRNLTSFYRDDD